MNVLKVNIGKIDQATGETWKTESVTLPTDWDELRQVFKRLKIKELDEVVIVNFEGYSSDILRLLNKIGDLNKANEVGRRLYKIRADNSLLQACLQTHEISDIDQLLEIAGRYKLAHPLRTKAEYGYYYAVMNTVWMSAFREDKLASECFDWEKYGNRILEIMKDQAIVTDYGTLILKER